MKDFSFQDCIDSNTAKKVFIDELRVRSLIKVSSDRLEVIAKITKKSCNFVFEDYYTSILELLQALAMKKGYNISNHLCLGYFLRDYLDRSDLFFMFDDLRYKRNSLTYYGNMMEYDVALDAIEKSKKLIFILDKLVLE